jgi:peptide/nickel transport system permease protein
VIVKFLLGRLVWIPVVLWAVASLTFLVMRLVPGTPIDFIATQNLPVEQLARMEAVWGLDQPLWRQYGAFLSSLAQGDLGIAMSSATPVRQMLWQRMPPTIELAVVALVLSSIIGMLAGIVSSLARGHIVDHAIRLVALVGLSIPWFWLAIVLIIIFSVRLQWTPVGGRMGAGVQYTPITNFVLIDTVITGNWTALRSFLRHLWLPATAIGISSAGAVMRLTRSAMLEVLSADYVRTARAKGLSERTVVLRHALRNAMLPVLTFQGLQLGALLGGAVISEIVFSWPGLGRMLLDGILKRDYPVVQGTIIFVAFFYVVANLVVDTLYHVVDPRMRRS